MFAALPLVWKIGAPLGLVLALIGGLMAYEHYQQSIGRAKAEAEYMADRMQQQQEAIGYFIVGSVLKLQAVERAMEAKDRFHARMREPQQEAVSHETPITQEIQDTPACVVSSRIVRDVNRWARVLNDTAAERDDAPGGADSPLPGAGSSSGPGGAGDGEGSRRSDL